MPDATQEQATKPRRRRAPQPADLLTVPDALLHATSVATFIGLSITQLYRLARAGDLTPAVRKPRCTRWRAGDVACWLAKQGSTKK